MAADRPKHPGGRPAQGPKTGKASAFATRITPETRALLEQEAAATDQSISQVAEQWLEKAYEAKDAGPQVGSTLLELGRFAKRVRDEIGDPERDASAKAALIEGWQQIIRRALPHTPGGPRIAELNRLEADLASAAGRALEALQAAPVDDPVVVAAVRPATALFGSPTKSGLFGGGAAQHLASERVVGPSIWEELDRAAAEPHRVSWGLADRLEEVATVGVCAKVELMAAATALRAYVAAIKEIASDYDEAQRRGRELAGQMLGFRTYEAPLPPVTRLPQI